MRVLRGEISSTLVTFCLESEARGRAQDASTQCALALRASCCSAPLSSVVTIDKNCVDVMHAGRVYTVKQERSSAGPCEAVRVRDKSDAVCKVEAGFKHRSPSKDGS